VTCGRQRRLVEQLVVQRDASNELPLSPAHTLRLIERRSPNSSQGGAMEGKGIKEAYVFERCPS
jgi:hypothetical protein